MARLARKFEQFLDGVTAALGILKDAVEIFAGTLFEIVFFHHQTGKKGDPAERIVEFVCHAGRQLLQQPTSKRLVLLITDGEPADIDERDPRYLREDCRHAVGELAAQGVHSFCLTLDPQADGYVERIFGANHYSIVDNLAALPERLPRVFSTLTGA